MNAAEQFEALVTAHYEPLFRFAMSLTRAEAEARDLTQQTFSTWAAKGDQLRDPSRAKAWLFTTLHRAFLGSRRRQSRFSFRTLESVSEELPVVAPDFSGQTDSAEVLSALAKTDEIYQAAVALYYLEDYSYRDIAAILEVPVGTVKSRIARGLSQIRGILGCAEPQTHSVAARGAGTEMPAASQPLPAPANQKKPRPAHPRNPGSAAMLGLIPACGNGTSAFHGKPWTS